MEIYSKTTRFALACNNSEKIIEPIQSRCAVLRYSRLTDAQVLSRVLDVCSSEKVDYAEDGLEAILFTAQGDMRQALNNLQGEFATANWIRHVTLFQATHSGLGIVNSENVFKVCDEPHPLMLSKMLDHCIEGQIDEAVAIVTKLFNFGYASEDIIQNIFK